MPILARGIYGRENHEWRSLQSGDKYMQKNLFLQDMRCHGIFVAKGAGIA